MSEPGEEYTFVDAGIVLEGGIGIPWQYVDAKTGEPVSAERLKALGIEPLEPDE